MHDSISKERSQRVQSVEVAFSILKVLGEHKASMNLSELAKATGLHKSQLYRYLNSFVHLGVLMRDEGESPRWSLGLELIALGGSASDSLDLTKYARTHLVKLRDKLNESAALSIWRERGAFFVQYEKSNKLINIDFEIGSYVPLFTATGKVFRAFLPEEITDALYQKEILEGNIKPSEYDQEIQEIRKIGFSKSESSLMYGTAAISAPVFYKSGALAGAVSVVGVHGNLDVSLESQASMELIQTANEISRQLGYMSDSSTR